MLRYCLGHCIKEMQLRVKPWKKLNITLIWSLEDMALIFFFLLKHIRIVVDFLAW